MQINKDELEKLGHGRAWQFFLSVHNAVNAMDIYKLYTIHYLKLKRGNLVDIIEGNVEIREEEKLSFPPGDWLEIEGCNISLAFLVWLNTYNFFQSSRNCFDYMAQIIAEFFPNDKLGLIDFGEIAKKMDSFENEALKGWINNVNMSDLYKYIDDYCNTVKHNQYLPTRITVQTSDLEMTGYMQAFKKQVKDDVHVYEETEITEQMNSVRKFTVETYGKYRLSGGKKGNYKDVPC